MAQYQSGLFGCFEDPRLCILTFCLPCYTTGKNAEYLGEDCLVHGLLCGIGLNFGAVIRWRLRQKKELAGTMLSDVLLHTVLPCCALVQDAREIGWPVPQKLQRLGRRQPTAQGQPQAQQPQEQPQEQAAIARE